MMPEDLSADGNASNAPAPEVVDRDVACVRCGYNLRMLQQSGRCPECGTSVVLSLELGAELAKSRPAYVRRLSRACWLLFVARALPFTCVLAEPLLGEFGWVPVVVLLMAVLAYSSGLWLLAAREHPHLPPELRWTSRGLRLASLTFFVCLLVMSPALLVVLSSDFGLNWQTGARRLPAAISWVFNERLLEWSGIVCLVVCVVCPVMETRLMVRLARRLANAWLGEHALIAGVGTCLSTGVILALLSRGQSASAGAKELLIVFGAAVLLLLFWGWMALCSWIAARGFSRAARQADDRWRRPEAAANTL